jgi:hypothetical protein
MRSTGVGEDPPRRIVESWVSPRAPFLSPLLQAAASPEACCLPLPGEAARCFTPPDELYAEQDAYEAEQSHTEAADKP